MRPTREQRLLVWQATGDSGEAPSAWLDGEAELDSPKERLAQLLADQCYLTECLVIARRIVSGLHLVFPVAMLERVAARGWPAEMSLEAYGDTFELRCAIQDEAKRVLEGLEP